MRFPQKSSFQPLSSCLSAVGDRLCYVARTCPELETLRWWEWAPVLRLNNDCFRHHALVQRQWRNFSRRSSWSHVTFRRERTRRSRCKESIDFVRKEPFYVRHNERACVRHLLRDFWANLYLGYIFQSGEGANKLAWLEDGKHGLNSGPINFYFVFSPTV